MKLYGIKQIRDSLGDQLEYWEYDANGNLIVIADQGRALSLAADMTRNMQGKTRFEAREILLAEILLTELPERWLLVLICDKLREVVGLLRGRSEESAE